MRVSFIAALAVAVAAVVALVAVRPGLTGPAGSEQEERPDVLLTVRDARITESSGLAASVRHPGVLYTHNDSGDRPRVYAVGPDGRTRAALTLRGASARDWEGMAAGRDEAGRPALFIGDIGDNLHGAWPSISVYRIREPATLRDATVPATRYRLRYADGARDAEALLIDPRTNRLYIASKEDKGAGLYQAPAKLRSDRVNVLRRVAKVPPAVTDGAFAPGGGGFTLRDYGAAHVYAALGSQPSTVELPLQLQGESITYTRDGRGLLAGSEGAASEIWRVPLPPAMAGAPAQAQAPARAPGSQAARDPVGVSAVATAAPPPEPAASGRAPLVTVAVAALALALVILVGSARRRRPR
jgi:hypothetical protein